MLQLNASLEMAIRLLPDDIRVGRLVRVVLGTRDHAVLVHVHQVEHVAQELEAHTAAGGIGTVRGAQLLHVLRHGHGNELLKTGAGISSRGGRRVAGSWSQGAAKAACTCSRLAAGAPRLAGIAVAPEDVTYLPGH